MGFFSSVLLGAVQGITEFLPISSSGHLVILKDLLNIETQYGFLFNIFVHLGTLVAIIYYYLDDIKGLLKGILLKEKKSITYLLFIIIATLPVAFVGIIFNNRIKALNNIEWVSYFLLITGLVVFLSKFTKEKEIKLNYLDIMVIGFSQAIAILPGISRSGMTITAALLLGINRNEASKLSFFMAIPAILGATFLEMVHINSLESINVMDLITGFGTAAIIGYFSISWLIKLINKLHFWKFSFYAWSVGLIMLIWDYYGNN